MAFRNGKIILSMALAFLLAGSGPVFGQATKTFTGKISRSPRGPSWTSEGRAIFYFAVGGVPPGQIFPISRRRGEIRGDRPHGDHGPVDSQEKQGAGLEGKVDLRGSIYRGV